MIIKAIALLLIFLAVLALFGRLRWPRLRTARCATCGKAPARCRCPKERRR